MPEAQTVQPRPLLPGQKSPPPYLSAETRVPAPQSGTSGTVLQTQSTASRPGGTGQSNTIPQPDPGHILSFISRASQDQELDPSRPMRLATVLRGLETGSTAKEAPSQLINDLQTVLAGKEHSAADAGPAKEAATLARFLEIHSQINSQPAPQARQDFLLFPCFFAGNAGWGEWMFSFTKEGETGQGSSDEESYSLAFYLEMSRLGDVHIRVQAGEDGLQGIFSLADDEARTFVASQLDTLRQNFEDMGYGPVNLSCQTSKTGSLQRLKEEMTEKCGRQSFTILDLTV